MELKVWVEGIQRIVCGVTVNTTCQDVVFALAHATGKVGRFTLIERWRNNERLLAPQENPLKLLLKWGEYANDVQFILQRSETKTQQQQQVNQNLHQVQHNNKEKENADGNRSIRTGAVIPTKPLCISNSKNNNISNNRHSNSSVNNNSSIDKTYSGQQQQNYQQQQHQSQTHQSSPVDYNINTPQYDKSKELRKSFGAHDVKYNENIGIVRGIPQRNNNNTNNNNNNRQVKTQLIENATSSIPIQESPTTTRLVPRHEKSHSNPIEMTNTNNNNSNNRMLDNFSFNNNNNNNIYHQLGAQNSKSINEINLAEVRNALDRRVTSNSANQSDNMEVIFSNTNNSNGNINNKNNNDNICQMSNENLLDNYNDNAKFNNGASSDLYSNAPTISANGALVPPPYRNPPPPRNSPLQHQQIQQQQQFQSTSTQQHRNTNPVVNGDFTVGNLDDSNFEYKNFDSATMSAVGVNITDESESIFQASQYSDLLQLIKYQREKISAQQLEINKFDAEIGFLESKEHDHSKELEAIAREITKADQIFRQGSEQLQTLQYVEEENELVKQQEKTLKSEITLLRSKLANCETELLQCKNKMRLIMDDIEMEQRDISNKQKNNRQNVERDFLMEMERIQIEIDHAVQNADTSNKTTDNLKKEIVLIENAIADKKRQLEQLINEMKEVNLQSLTVTTSEEIKHLLEAPNKPGSSRRIIGSPRQLENAVPTSKNPHGVWV